jgi:hypothetical protein
MAADFTHIVDEVYQLSLDEKQELRDILDEIIHDARKVEIIDAYRSAKEEEENGTLHRAKNARDTMNFLHSS